MANRTDRTGTYAVRDGRVVKISSKVPKLPPRVYFRSDGVNGMFIETLGDNGTWVDSPKHKRELMEQHQVGEY